jgi:hypothetical protein
MSGVGSRPKAGVGGMTNSWTGRFSDSEYRGAGRRVSWWTTKEVPLIFDDEV